MLSKRNQTKKATYCIIPLREMSKIGKSTETESRLVVASGWRERGGGIGITYFLLGLMKMFLELDNSENCTTL